MTDAEKFYSILTDCKNPLHWLFRNNADFLNLAKYLTDAGVTAQSWIPVTERLPETGESVLVYRGPDTLMNVDYRLGPGLCAVYAF